MRVPQGFDEPRERRESRPPLWLFFLIISVLLLLAIYIYASY